MASYYAPAFNVKISGVPLAASVLYSPTYAIGAYLALGLIVLASRLILPKANAPATSQTSAVADERQELPKAA